MPLQHESIADILEKELVKKVLRDPYYRDVLLNIKGLLSEGARILREVELREFRKDLKGDIDILVVPPDAPEESTAIQVKRFKAKVSPAEATTVHPNRLRKLFTKGVRQANDLAAIGFSQVYLWVFVVVDTRAQNGGRFSYDGADSRLQSRLRQAISPVNLDPQVGLMTFEWVQPMDRAPFELGTHGGHLEQLGGA